MNQNSNNAGGLRSARALRLTLAAAVSVMLAACGGGGGGGGNDSAAPPQPCTSQNSLGDGFALGSCAATLTNVFQPVVSTVNVAGVDSYSLTLTFPAGLASLSGVTPFTAANKPSGSERNIIGLLRGQAYENPLRPTLTPPYVALTDFFQAWNYQDDTSRPKILSLTYASFGTWEKFANAGSFNEGYLGTWFAERPNSTKNIGPAGTKNYAGFAVGIVAPDGTDSSPALQGRFGFSGPITIAASGTGIDSATLPLLTISFQTQGSSTVQTQALNTDDPNDPIDIRPLSFSDSTGAPPALMTGTLLMAGGGTGTTLMQGVYEARFFGADGFDGVEIAGRFRFRTSNGLIAVGSFGARLVP